MKDHEREWLLRALAHAGSGAVEELTCEVVRDQLSLLVEAELNDEDVRQSFPHIFNHLYTCPDCHHIYKILHETLIDNEFLAPEVEAATPGPVSYSPARPLLLAEALNWARDQMQFWQRTLQSQGLVYRSSAEDNSPTQPIAIPGYDQAAVELSLFADGRVWLISGSIDPPAPSLQGVAFRLYTLVGTTATPEVSAVVEAIVDDFDTFSFEPVPVGQYVLSVVRPEGEVGLTFIGRPGSAAI